MNPPDVELNDLTFINWYVFRSKAVGPDLKVKVPLAGQKIDTSDWSVDYYSAQDSYASAKFNTSQFGRFGFGELEGRLYPLEGALEDDWSFSEKGKLLWTPPRMSGSRKVGGLEVKSKLQVTLDYENKGEDAWLGARAVSEIEKGGWGIEVNSGAQWDMGVQPRGAYCRNMCHYRQAEEYPSLELHWPYPLPELLSRYWSD
jgi:hypothetical protein